MPGRFNPYARPKRVRRLATALLGLSALATAGYAVHASAPRSDTNWPVYGGNVAGQRYSTLRQITPANVKQLKMAWRVDLGPGSLQASPLMIGGVLYAVGPDQSVLALDAASGRQLWRFTPETQGFQPARGLSYWTDGKVRRIFASSSNYLYAIDPETGKAAAEFGTNGRVDLREGLGRDPKKLAVFLTSPGTVYRDLIITGFRTGESSPAAPGAIRAYDVRTGKMRWIFHTIPSKDDPAAKTWPANAQDFGSAVNNWCGMTLDEKRGIVYVPTGSAASDFYGADRIGDNLYANTLLALDAATGRRLWHFQAVHHDVWDRDLPSPPSLLTVTHGGKRIDAVVQATKQGNMFLFNRVTGAPLFPIDEKPVPQTQVPGEQTSPTQPFPRLPLPFSRQRVTENDLTQRTPAAHAAALALFRSLQSDGPFTPPPVGRKAILTPGFDGGAEWGGVAIDPVRAIVYVNAQNIATMGGLRKNAATPSGPPGKAIYDQQCSGCHGPERAGNPPDFPSLVDIGKRLTRDQVAAIVAGGRGRMPGFPQIDGEQRSLLLDFLFNLPPMPDKAMEQALRTLSPKIIAEYMTMKGSDKEAYLYTGYERFRDPDGYPATSPPWGTLNAINLNTGAYLWKIPFGEYPELVSTMGITGTENYGGPLVTASRLLFIGATIYDHKFRAFDASNGHLLWETVLPFSGVATPITYTAHGRQYVVIATSSQRDPKAPQGTAYVAFALPR